MACNPTYKGKRYDSLGEIKKDLSYPDLAKLYHTSKASGERPEFVKSIEELFNNKQNEKSKNAQGENTKGKNQNAEGQNTQNKKAEVLAKATGIIEKTEFDGVHEEMKKNPEEFLKYISEQANGSEEARTELESGKGMTKSLIDLATELYPADESISSPKIDNNGSSKQGRQQEGISKETLHEESEGSRKKQEGLSHEETLTPEGAEDIGGEQGITSPSLKINDQINFGGKVWTVEEITDKDVKISDPKTNTITTIPRDEAEKNIKQPSEENKNLAAAQILRDSASRLRESGDEEGANKLEERAQELEDMEKVPPNITSVANKIVNKERAARGLDPIQKAVKRAWKTEVLKDANEDIDSGKVDPQMLARELNKNPRPLTDTEDAILTIGRMQLWNAHKNTMGAIEEAVKKGDKGAETVARMGLTYIEDAMYENDLASKKSGTQNARGLAARRMMIASDYSLANQKQRYRIANMGKEIPKDVVEKMEKYSRDLDEANRKLAEYEEKLKNAAAEKELTNVKEVVKKSPKAPKKAHEDFVKERKEIVNDIRDKLKKARGETTATLVPYAKELFTIAPDVAKLVRSLVEEGVSKLEDIVKNVHETLKDEIKGITEKDVNDIIAGEYNEKKKPVSELASKLKDLREEANLINKLDQLKKSPEPKEETKKVERNKEITELREKIAEEKRLPEYKQRLQKQIKDTEQAIKDKNFEGKKRVPIVLDREAQILQGQVEDIKRKFDEGRIKLEKANRTKYEKTLDFLTKWYRLDLLSGVTVLGKLTSAAQLRMALTPLEEGIGGVLSHIPGISSIAKQAPREGGFSIAAETKAVSQYVQKATYQDMWNMIRSGKNPMELIYGKKYDLPAEAIGFFGQLHSALKVLPKRAEFNRSFEKRYAWAKMNGQDVSDPMVQTQIASAAYNDASRAIFMQDNLVSDAYKLGLNYLESKGNGGKAVGYVLRTLLPIIKVPTNIVGEAFSYAGGGVKAAVMARKQIAGGMKMALGLKKGIDKLTPDQADTVMRNLKKQTLGAAFLALGYFGSANVGGYYTGKRDEDEVEEGGLRMFGVDIPKWMVHNPALEMLQLGATIRKVQDKYEEAGKDKALEAGALAGLSGLIGQVPFIDNPKRVTEAIKSPNAADKYADEFIKSLTIPQIIQEAAKQSDEDEKGNVIKRYPTNLLEYEESGIPGARKNVPDEK